MSNWKWTMSSNCFRCHNVNYKANYEICDYFQLHRVVLLERLMKLSFIRFGNYYSLLSIITSQHANQHRNVYNASWQWCWISTKQFKSIISIRYIENWNGTNLYIISASAMYESFQNSVPLEPLRQTRKLQNVTIDCSWRPCTAQRCLHRRPTTTVADTRSSPADRNMIWDLEGALSKAFWQAEIYFSFTQLIWMGNRPNWSLEESYQTITEDSGKIGR